MFEKTSYLKRNLFFLAKIIFTLLGIFFFTAVSCQVAFNFSAFPIEGCKYEMGEHFPLAQSTRIILSVIWYVFLLGTFATIPLHHIRCFEKTSFYLAYKKFWVLSAIIFSALWTVLTDMVPANLLPLDNPYFNKGEVIIYLIFLTILSTIIWRLAVLPASIQHNAKNNTH